MKLSGDSAVPTKISGVDGKSMRVAPGTSSPRKQEQAADKADAGSGAGSSVQLTGAARNMVALEQSLHSLPVVDEQRVAAVRQRLDRGEYQIDPQRIADKLLSLENDLRRGTPVSLK